MGRPATEEDPALPGGDGYKGSLRVRNIVEFTVVGLAERGVRSSIVRIPPIANTRPIPGPIIPVPTTLALTNLVCAIAVILAVRACRPSRN